MSRYRLEWQAPKSASGIRYTCGYCGTDTTPSLGWCTEEDYGYQGHVLICTNCNRPSFVETRGSIALYTIPAARIGQDVAGLPDDVGVLYNEARSCTSTGAYTSAVLICRKILMHVAVEKGAGQGLNFIDYVDYLHENHYIPPDGRDWVDHIRAKSNEANQEIVIMKRDDAADLVSFTEMLLRLVYEFPHRLTKDDSP